MFLTDIISTLATRPQPQGDILTSSPSLVLSDKQILIKISTVMLPGYYLSIGKSTVKEKILVTVCKYLKERERNFLFYNYFISVVTIKHWVERAKRGKRQNLF